MSLHDVLSELFVRLYELQKGRVAIGAGVLHTDHNCEVACDR